MENSYIYQHIAKRANFFGVNQTFFKANVALAGFLIVFVGNLLLAVFLFVFFNLLGAYISKKDPDFFDVLLENKKFTLSYPLHKIDGRRKWEA